MTDIIGEIESAYDVLRHIVHQSNFFSPEGKEKALAVLDKEQNGEPETEEGENQGGETNS